MKQIYILLIALLMGLSANAERSGTCGPNLKWYLNDNGVLTITGKEEMYDYSDYYSRDRVPWGYYLEKVKRIIIYDGVTKIGGSAFEGCSALTSVTIPNSVTKIGDRAFADCSALTSVTIPNGVRGIGDRAFYNCSSLTSVTIPNGVRGIGDFTFAGCRSLSSVTIPNSVTKIGDRAFANCIYNHRTTKTNQKYPSVNL